jgi:hypothetical protein
MPHGHRGPGRHCTRAGPRQAQASCRRDAGGSGRRPTARGTHAASNTRCNARVRRTKRTRPPGGRRQAVARRHAHTNPRAHRQTQPHAPRARRLWSSSSGSSTSHPSRRKRSIAPSASAAVGLRARFAVSGHIATSWRVRNPLPLQGREERGQGAHTQRERAARHDV